MIIIQVSCKQLQQREEQTELLGPMLEATLRFVQCQWDQDLVLGRKIAFSPTELILHAYISELINSMHSS